MIRLLVILTPFGLLLFTQLYAAELITGPMVGHTTPTSAKIWVETDVPSDVQITYWVAPNNQAVYKNMVSGKTTKDAPHTAVVTLNNLSPQAQIHYEVRLNKRLIRPLSPQIFFTLPPEPQDDKVANFMVAFGSCMNPSNVPYQPIWNKAVQFRPAAFLYIGDINYLPSPELEFGEDPNLIRETMAIYHRDTRHLQGIRTLMATTPSYGIWDDHDFGPNNSDKTFKWREETLDLYNRYWANPSAGLADTKGIFYKFKIADAEFFMLDNRYHRESVKDENRTTMFGQAQMDWLKKSLAKSSATFKIIVQGGSSVVDGQGELWSHWGTERDDFLTWMFGEKISGVFFLAGDWHVGTLNRLHRPQDAYPLYELLSSNTGVRKEPIATDPTSGSGGHNQSAAIMYRGYNFGAVSFAGKKGERTVSLQIIDENGHVQIHRRLSEKDLSPKSE